MKIFELICNYDILWYKSFWKCNWKSDLKNLKNSKLKNKILDLESKTYSDPIIGMMNMNRF